MKTSQQSNNDIPLDPTATNNANDNEGTWNDDKRKNDINGKGKEDQMEIMDVQQEQERE